MIVGDGSTFRRRRPGVRLLQTGTTLRAVGLSITAPCRRMLQCITERIRGSNSRNRFGRTWMTDACHRKNCFLIATTRCLHAGL